MTNQRKYLIATIIGILIGTLNNIDLPYESPPNYKIVYEKYIQRPQTCDKTRTTYHSIIAFKPKIPKSILERVSFIKIFNTDTFKSIKVNLTEERYFYDNLFNKPRHFETRREYCEFGDCQMNINFYQEQYEGHEKKKYELQFFEQNGERIWTDEVQITENLSNIENGNQENFPNLSISYDDDKLLVGVKFIEKTSSDLMVQYGMNRKRFEIPQSYSPKTELTEELDLPDNELDYLAAYIYNEISGKGFETKVELKNHTDDFMSICS